MHKIYLSKQFYTLNKFIYSIVSNTSRDQKERKNLSEEKKNLNRLRRIP